MEKKSAANKTSTTSSRKTSTASSKKLLLCAEKTTAEIDEGEFFLVHTTAFEQMQSKIICEKCKDLGSVKFKLENQYGYAAKCTYHCTTCESVLFSVNTSPYIDDSRKNSGFSVNKNIVEGFNDIGCGHEAMKKFSVALGMHTMSHATYTKYLKVISDEASELKVYVLSLSCKVVHEEYKKEYTDLQDQDVIDTVNSYDGTWSKRGFTALYSIGIVIDDLTGLVVDYEILSKFCYDCVFMQNDVGEDSPEYAIWYDGHKNKCSKNFDGSSASMETAAAEVLWKRSVENCKMRYTTIISDGDAKTFTHLNKIAVYGPDHPLTKEECINHIVKRLHTALKKVISDCRIKGVTLSGRGKGALTEKVICVLCSYYRAAVLRNSKDVQAMKCDILASIYHCASTNEKHNHKYCPKGKNSWCFYQKAIAFKQVPKCHSTMQVFLNEKVFEAVLPIYQRLSSDELLSRCTMCKTQNRNESLHAMIWQLCPKTNFTSKAKLEIAVAKAVSQFNMGAVETLKALHRITSSNVPEKSLVISEARDKKRLRSSDYKSSDEQKEKRICKKFKLSALESKKIEKEGLTYGAGEF